MCNLNEWPVGLFASRRACLSRLAAGALVAWAPVTASAEARSAIASTTSAPESAPLTLARTAPDDWEPNGWLISEKLDGVRAWWDGRSLRFRSGLPIAAPDWFLAELPALPMDGELWLGRGTFEALVSAVRRKLPSDVAWRSVGLHVFDAPGVAGTFESRFETIQSAWRRRPSALWRPIEHRRLTDATAVQAWLDQVLAQGGEGLMAHRADAPHSAGRSDLLLKIKRRQDDEAWVIGHLPGRGRLSGQLGALKVRNRAGVTFELGSGLNEDLRRRPPALGQMLTYRYQGLTAQGVPRFATFWRLCPDV